MIKLLPLILKEDLSIDYPYAYKWYQGYLSNNILKHKEKNEIVKKKNNALIGLPVYRVIKYSIDYFLKNFKSEKTILYKPNKHSKAASFSLSLDGIHNYVNRLVNVTNAIANDPNYINIDTYNNVYIIYQHIIKNEDEIIVNFNNYEDYLDKYLSDEEEIVLKCPIECDIYKILFPKSKKQLLKNISIKVPITFYNKENGLELQKYI